MAELGVLVVGFLVGLIASRVNSAVRRAIVVGSACVICAFLAGVVTGELAQSPFFFIWDLAQGLAAGAAGILAGGLLARRVAS